MCLWCPFISLTTQCSKGELRCPHRFALQNFAFVSLVWSLSAVGASTQVKAEGAQFYTE